MGIDIYMRWPGMTEEERKAQYTGFSVVHGHSGYLREAYHGGPYVTDFLVKEAFTESEDYYDRLEAENPDMDDDYPSFEGAHIPAKVLRERLPKALQIAKARLANVYNETLEDDDPYFKSFEDFVALAEEKEAIHGEGVKILASW